MSTTINQIIIPWNRTKQSHACYLTATWILYCTILHHTLVVSCCFKSNNMWCECHTTLWNTYSC